MERNLSGLTISANVDFARKYGLVEAILLNKIIFLCNHTPREDGFCWITRKQFEDETTIKPQTFARAWKRLVELGVIEEKKDYVIGTQLLTTHFRYIGENKNQPKEEKVEVVEKETLDVDNLLTNLSRILKYDRVCKITEGRRRKLKKRLKEFSKDDILLAAEHLSQSSWHMGNNPNNKKYATVDFLLRSDEKIEEWLFAEPEQAQVQKVARNII